MNVCIMGFPSDTFFFEDSIRLTHDWVMLELLEFPAPEENSENGNAL